MYTIYTTGNLQMNGDSFTNTNTRSVSVSENLAVCKIDALLNKWSIFGETEK